MSEQINVDHAFDPEARKAQADLNAYMNSRPYDDEKGNLHDPNTGSSMKKDDFRYADENDGYYADSLSEGDYSGESLEQLAQRVAAARAEGDKTRANDAEDAFFAKFSEFSDKYGWENEDGSADGPHVKKDAKLGRSTIDDRLDRYSKIMYGEENTAKAEVAEPEILPEVTTEVPADQAQDTPAELEVSPEAEQEEEAEDKPAAFNVDEEVAAINDTDQAREDRELLTPISTEGLRMVGEEASLPLVSTEGLKMVGEPNEEAADEGESLEEYEARNSMTPEKIALIETAGLEPVEADSDPVVVRSKRLRDRFSPTALYARASAGVHSRKAKREQTADAAEDKERSGKEKVALIGLGVLGVAATGVGLYLAHKYGAADALSTPKGGSTESKAEPLSGISAKAQELFGNGRVEVRSGDGSTQVLDRVLSSHDINLTPNELYDLHQHLENVKGEYINLEGVNDTYVLPNGDSGLSRPDEAARINEGTQKAAVRWLQSRGKLS